MLFRIALVLLALTAPLAAQSPPNVVVIYCDDLGYGDLGCFGAKDWATPHLDALAKGGVRLTDFYVAQPVCSASRAALLTGCYPNRIGIAGALGPNAKVGIHADETTLAEVFKSKGYRTGMAGKWHLGHHALFLPLRHGFDSWLGLPYSNDMWPRHPSAKAGTYPPLPLFDGNTVADADVSPEAMATLTKRYTTRAVEFIREHQSRPFFFYLAHSMPHVPLFSTKDYAGRTKTAYGDIVTEIDDSVGQVVKALTDCGLRERTLIVFTSDNGPWLPYGTHAGGAAGLREGKGSVWEGGVRVPCIAAWPGVIPPASTCAAPCMTIDLLPTMAKLINAELPKHAIDGRDIAPLLRTPATAKSPHEALAFYYLQNELQAVRAGAWKLVLPHTYRSLNGKPGGTGGKPAAMVAKVIKEAELYNLDTDRHETTDLAAKNAEVVAAMMRHVERFRTELGDSLVKRTGAGVRQPGKVE